MLAFVFIGFTVPSLAFLPGMPDSPDMPQGMFPVLYYGNVPQFPQFPPQFPVQQQIVETSSSPPNSLLSLIQTVAQIMNKSIDLEREKEYRQRHLNAMRLPSDRNLTPKLSNYQHSLPSATETRRLVDRFNYPRESFDTTAQLVNSLPKPPIMYQIGHFLEQQNNEPMFARNEAASFPIEKESDISTTMSYSVNDDTLLGLIQSGRWKTIEWRRKILGIDELPTREEGNAILQLLEDNRSLKTADSLSKHRGEY